MLKIQAMNKPDYESNHQHSYGTKKKNKADGTFEVILNEKLAGKTKKAWVKYGARVHVYKSIKLSTFREEKTKAWKKVEEFIKTLYKL